MMRMLKKQRKNQIKRAAAYLLIFAMLVGLIPGNAFVTYAANGDNLITNGDFENTLSANAKSVTVAGGTQQADVLGTLIKASGGDAGTSLTFEQVSVTGHDGAATNALKISSTDGASARKDLLMDVPKSSLASSAYKVSVWVKAVDMPEGSNFRIETFKYRNLGKAFSTGAQDVFVKKNVMGHTLGDWTLFTEVITADRIAEVKGTLRVQLTFRYLSEGYLLMDDLKLEPWTLVETVALSAKTKEVYVGDTLQLVPTVSPATASDKTVEFTSSDEAVAVVDETGKVTALSKGKAVITATAVNGGVTATCTVTVRSDKFITNGDFENTLGSTAKSVTVAGGVSKEALLGTNIKATGGNSGTGITFEQVSGVGVGDTNALKIFRAEGATAGKNLTVDIPVSSLGSGLTYRLSARLKAVDVTDNNFKVDFKYNYTGNTGSDTYLIQGVQANTFTDWTLVSKVITAAELSGKQNNLQVNLCLDGMSNGYLLIDDLELIPWTAVTDVTLPCDETKISVGCQQSLTAMVSPMTASDSTVKYISSDETMAIVDENGTVTALSEGTVVITATSVDDNTKYDTCTVTVTRDNIVLNGDFENTEDGSDLTLTKEEGSLQGLLGTSLMALVGDGEITFRRGRAAGADGASTNVLRVARAVIELEEGEVQDIARTNLIVDIPVDKLNTEVAYKLSVSVRAGSDTPDATSFTLKYKNLGTGEETVCVNGERANLHTEWITFSKVITAAEMKGMRTTFRINIYIPSISTGYVLIDDLELVPWIAVETLTLPYHSKYLEIGDVLSLPATISPEYTPENEVLYTSSNEAVATVDENGKVTALAEGETVITATAPNGGAKDSCVVTVVNEYVSLDAISMDGDLALFTGGQKQLTVNFDPANATAKKVTWSSSDESIVAVSPDGVVTALKAGTATITAEGENNTSATCVVTVKDSTSLSATEASLTADFGTLLSGTLTEFITNNTGAATSFTLYQGTTHGTIKVNADGTFTYMPKVYDAEGTIKYLPTADVKADGTDTFQVLVTAGDQATLLTGKITVDLIEEKAKTNLTSDLTLLASKEEIESIKAQIVAGDPTMVKLWNNLKAEADRIMLKPIPKYEDHSESDNAEGNWIRGVADRIPNLLFAALLNPDETEAAAYKAKCIEYLEAVVVGYPFWAEKGGEDGENPIGGVYGEGHLAAGHAGFAAAVAASWLYDDLTPELKMSVHQRMYKACVAMDYIWRNHDNIIGNHMWNAFGAMTAATMLMYAHSEDAFAAISALDPDKAKYELGLTINQEKSVEELEASCVKWFDLICDQIGVAFDLLPADGTNHESPMYHTYGLEDLLKITLLMDKNLDVDMFTGNSWLEKSIDYFLNIIVPVESLDGTRVLMGYGNAHKYIEYGASPLMRVLASYYQNGTAQWVAEKLEDKNADPVSETLMGTCFWMSLLYVDADLEVEDPTDRPTLYYGDDLGIVVSRTNWSGKEAMVFLRAGIPLGKRNQANMIAGLVEIGHSCGDHQDIDCNAIRLFYNEEELLRENGYKVSKSTGSQSTLLVAGNGQLRDGYGSQSSIRYEALQANPEITKTETTELYDYFVGDATEAYEPELGLAKFARHTVLIKEANVLLVVDDIKAIQDTELELRWFTGSKDVSDLNDYGYYTILNRNSEMRFYPLTSEGVTTAFEEVEYLKYHSTAMTEEEAFSQKATTASWQNAVAFTWSDYGDTQPYVYYEKGAAGEHKFEIDGKVYTIDVNFQTVTVEEKSLNIESTWADNSKLSAVLLNGFALEGFSADQYEYTVEKNWKTATLDIQAITCTPTATTEVEWDGSCPGTMKIICTSDDKSSQTVYTFNFTNHKNLLTIVSAEADKNTHARDVNHSFDGYIDPTGSELTWACINLPTITYDLGEVVSVAKIDVAFNYSNQRDTYFDLLISKDGENWTMFKEGGIGKRTLRNGPIGAYRTVAEDVGEIRYIRFYFRGTSNYSWDDPNAYGSIQEIDVYGYTAECTLNFETDGGNEITAVTQAAGTVIDLSEYVPEKAGHAFAGWYSDADLTNAITSVTLSQNTTVYAKWTVEATTTEPGGNALYAWIAGIAVFGIAIAGVAVAVVVSKKKRA